MAAFVKLATLDELPPGGTLEVEHAGRIVALFNLGGTIAAIDGLCPHQGGPLADGAVEGTHVTCPWHGWAFDLHNGTSTMGPRIKVDVFEVKLDGPDILVAIP